MDGPDWYENQYPDDTNKRDNGALHLKALVVVFLVWTILIGVMIYMALQYPAVVLQ